MLGKTEYSVPEKLVKEAIESLPNIDFRHTLNEPTGNFFYSPWKIKPEYKGTVWDKILGTIQEPIGEARLIKLAPGTCYRSHADIDDRFHLSLISARSYLVDLDANQMYPIEEDNNWYTLDASIRHSAINFGSVDRIQLVVRKLLRKGIIPNPSHVTINVKEEVSNFRFIFDDVFSPWIGQQDKQGNIDNFKIESETSVSFTIDTSLVSKLKSICPKEFEVVDVRS